MADGRETTTDHEVIRRWVEERGGVPTAVKNTLAGDDAGVLYIDFPGTIDKDVDEITWEHFFKVFDRQNLAFVYEDAPAGSTPRPFYQLIDRDTREPVQA